MLNLSTEMPLQKWLTENQPKPEMLWKGAFGQQAILFNFIADFYCLDLFVVSTHRSKSIDLPVVYIPIKDHTELIIRDNFHDQAVSITTTINPLDLPTILAENPSKEKISSCYCEGFKDEWCFDTYEKAQASTDNERAFTFNPYNVEVLLLTIKYLRYWYKKEDK